jgi:hypothetical protein
MLTWEAFLVERAPIQGQCLAVVDIWFFAPSTCAVTARVTISSNAANYRYRVRAGPRRAGGVERSSK